MHTALRTTTRGVRRWALPAALLVAIGGCWEVVHYDPPGSESTASTPDEPAQAEGAAVTGDAEPPANP